MRLAGQFPVDTQPIHQTPLLFAQQAERQRHMQRHGAAYGALIHNLWVHKMTNFPFFLNIFTVVLRLFLQLRLFFYIFTSV